MEHVAVNVWTARVIPVVLAGAVGYATYVVVVPLCVDYLLKKHDAKSAAIPILVIYFLLFLLMASSFFRLVYITTFDPPYVPLGPRVVRDRNKQNHEKGLQSKEDGIGGAEYDARADTGDTTADVYGSNNDPDSPGLELFYTKDVFVCELDGKPRWCSTCMNWKPDRTHHCSSSGRCIKKMDHFCPWVGGPVGENNFKFFLQFTGYAAVYTLHVLVVMSVYIWEQRTSENETVDRQFAATLALAGFFFLFTFGMTGTSIDLIVRNLTQVEKLGGKSRLQTLAVLKPSRKRLFEISPALASQPQYDEITYPLGAGEAPSANHWQAPEGYPQSKSYIHAQRSVCSQAVNISHPVSGQTQRRAGPVGSSISKVPQPLPNSTTGPIPSNNSTGGYESGLSTQSQADESAASRNSQPSKGYVSERDLKATRTFAILNMKKPGDNPWDLGSAIANWETVMGYTVLDWFLPVRRSPCCNHEDTESHYMVGPEVDLLRVSVGFVAPKDTHERGNRLKKQQRVHSRRVAVGRFAGRSRTRTNEVRHAGSTEMRDINREITGSRAM